MKGRTPNPNKFQDLPIPKKRQRSRRYEKKRRSTRKDGKLNVFLDPQAYLMLETFDSVTDICNISETVRRFFRPFVVPIREAIKNDDKNILISIEVDLENGHFDIFDTLNLSRVPKKI